MNYYGDFYKSFIELFSDNITIICGLCYEQKKLNL